MAAVISSFFNETGEYFCVLESPRMRRPDYVNEVIRRNNIVARLQAHRIILVGLEPHAVATFRQYFPAKIVTEIESVREVEGKLRELRTSSVDGEICCSPKEIAYGLLLAKKRKAKLTLDPRAPSLEGEFRESFPKPDHIMVVEDSGDLAAIIAANYAFSVNAGLKLIPEVRLQDIEKVYDELMDRRIFTASTRGKRAETTLERRSTAYQRQLVPEQPRFVTFVTRGIPYGHFFPDVPSTHLFSYPDLGLNIFAAIYHSSTVRATRSAVVLDPGHFKDSESDFVIQDLRHKGVFVKSLKGDQATVYEVRNHIQFFPYDLLYICCHAGEMDGNRLKIRFADRLGQSHTIVVDHAVAYAPTGEGKGENQRIQVSHFTGFVELDGIDWIDGEMKAAIGARELIEDFTNIPVQDWEVLESTDIPYVKNCAALKLTDHYCMVLLHLVADHEYPLIFNNACVSFYRFSEEFLFAGARAYIGTLAPIDNASAMALAHEVFRNLDETKCLPLVLWEVQRQLWGDASDRVYIHVGCHFTNILSPSHDTTRYVQSRLRAALERWSKRPRRRPCTDRDKDNIKAAVKFLAARIQELD